MVYKKLYSRKKPEFSNRCWLSYGRPDRKEISYVLEGAKINSGALIVENFNCNEIKVSKLYFATTKLS